jgi:hypothetical protein
MGEKVRYSPRKMRAAAAEKTPDSEGNIKTTVTITLSAEDHDTVSKRLKADRRSFSAQCSALLAQFAEKCRKLGI